MTTTHIFQGLNADNRPSSRVLNPPGGASSNIFGSDDTVKQQTTGKGNPPSVNRTYNPITGQAYEQQKQEQPQKPAPVTPDSTSKTLDAPTNQVAPAPAFEPVTAAPSHNKPQPAPQDAATSHAPQKQNQHQGGLFGGGAPDKEHTSTRVSQPPGGRSSKLW